VKKKELKRKLQKVEANRLCWVERWSAAGSRNMELVAEVAILDAECRELANWLMSGFVHVDESKVAEVDLLLNRFLGGSNVR
jgi:hypothetical protein